MPQFFFFFRFFVFSFTLCSILCCRHCHNINSLTLDLQIMAIHNVFCFFCTALLCQKLNSSVHFNLATQTL